MAIPAVTATRPGRACRRRSARGSTRRVSRTSMLELDAEEAVDRPGERQAPARGQRPEPAARRHARQGTARGTGVSWPDRVAEHREEVAGGAGHHEQVPDEVGVAQPGVEREERDADRVGEHRRPRAATSPGAARAPTAAPRRSRTSQPISEVQPGRSHGWRMRSKAFSVTPTRGERPDEAEQRPSPGARRARRARTACSCRR